MTAIMIYVLGYSRAAAVGRKVSEASSGFCVGQSTARKVLLLFFGTFLPVLAKFSFWGGGMGTGLSFYGI